MVLFVCLKWKTFLKIWKIKFLSCYICVIFVLQKHIINLIIPHG